MTDTAGESEGVTLSSRSSSPVPYEILSPSSSRCSTPVSFGSPPATSSSNSSASELCAYSAVSNSWAEGLTIPWDKMTRGISARFAMIRLLVDEMCKKYQNPSLRQCRIVARKVVSKYPESFQDRIYNEQLLGEGCYSLAKQIRARVEHINCGMTSARLRAQKRQVSQ